MVSCAFALPSRKTTSRHKLKEEEAIITILRQPSSSVLRLVLKCFVWFVGESMWEWGGRFIWMDKASQRQLKLNMSPVRFGSAHTSPNT